jgi:hypothetical protein
MTNNWHDSVFFGIHYDQHANAADTVLGMDLTYDHLRQRLEMVRPDWVQCDCKGHPGYTSWPTQVGTTAPGMQKDALAIYRAVTRDLGIPLGMHYSGVWDDRAIELHPEWAALQADGRPYGHATCPLSGYTAELMIPHMLEIISTYAVDGFWVDGENWASRICYCPRCKAEFTRRTGRRRLPLRPNQPGWSTWLAFQRDLFVEHVRAYTTAVHDRFPQVMICSNWMYTVRQPELPAAGTDYLSGDFDHAWGANRAAVEGRLLDEQRRRSGKSWDLMAWGFCKSGEWTEDLPWMSKPAVHLCQEVSEVLALGGAVMVYQTPTRGGWLTGWHQETIAQVAGFCRERRDLSFGTDSIPQAAILHLKNHFYAHSDPLFNYGTAGRPLEGALHALLETGRSTDLLIEDTAPEALAAYPLVIVPEQTHLSRTLQDALYTYAKNGGAVFLSGAHLAQDCPGLAGVHPLAPESSIWSGPLFFRLTDRLTASEVEPQAMTVPFPASQAAPWQPVVPLPGVETWACGLAGPEPTLYPASQALATFQRVGRGGILAVHGAVFESYYRCHYPMQRRWIAGLLQRLTSALSIPWLVEFAPPASQTATARLEMVLRRINHQIVIHLINRGAGEMFAPNRVVLEELPAVEDVCLRVRCDSPSSVSAPYEPADLTWEYADGYLTVHLSRVNIHNAVVCAF